jgi:AcrR family transcriptional regulator
VTETTRPYRSPRRAQQTAQTRRAILDAARLLFAGGGYAATSLDRIAQEAGVAVQTIYAMFRTKVALLAALNDLIDEEGGVTDVLGEMGRVQDPERLIALAAIITRQLNERFGDVMRTLYFAANTDPAAAEIWADGMRRHRDGSQYTAARIESLGALRSDLSLEKATDIIDFFTTPQSYMHLVADLGWSFDESEAWITQAMRQFLLTSAGDR